MKIRLGIIGLGIISRYHEEGLAEVRELVELAGICDIDRERAVRRAEPYGAAVYTDYRELLANPEIDTVDIILPHDLHYEVCKAALNAGKNVLIEKPFVTSLAEGEELIRLAEKRGCVLSVAENTPHVKAYLVLKTMLKRGELGKIYSVRTLIAGTEIYRMIDKTSWKGKPKASGGGVIMDAAPHSFYLLQWLFGQVRELQASSARVVPDCQVEDNAVISGLLEGDIFFDSSFSFTAQAPWTERLEVYGEKGTVIIDQIMKPSSLYYRGENDYEPLSLEEIPYDPMNWKGKSIAAGVASFLRSLYEGNIPAVSPREALDSVALCLKAYTSLEKKTKILV